MWRRRKVEAGEPVRDLQVASSALLYEPRRYSDVKDPSPVRFEGRWHLYGTGCGRPGGLEILHAVADELDGAWQELAAAVLIGADMVRAPAAPGVIVEGDRVHLFLQHDFDALGGAIEHLVSDDGATFEHRTTVLQSVAGGPEAGIYDPDPGLFDGVRHLTYAAMSVVGQPDVFLARASGTSWDGPWVRRGSILRHANVHGHNQVGERGYEWGLEGPQLVQLPGGRCLLTAVCFLSGRAAGHRQRLLLAIADQPIGPYRVLGTVAPVLAGRGRGETGHGTAMLDGAHLRIVYQERMGIGAPWRYVRATLDAAVDDAFSA